MGRHAKSQFRRADQIRVEEAKALFERMTVPTTYLLLAKAWDISVAKAQETLNALVHHGYLRVEAGMFVPGEMALEPPPKAECSQDKQGPMAVEKKKPPGGEGLGMRG